MHTSISTYITAIGMAVAGGSKINIKLEFKNGGLSHIMFVLNKIQRTLVRKMLNSNIPVDHPAKRKISK